VTSINASRILCGVEKAPSRKNGNERRVFAMKSLERKVQAFESYMRNRREVTHYRKTTSTLQILYDFAVHLDPISMRDEPKLNTHCFSGFVAAKDLR
jgi:hypothetical protein